LTQILTLGFLFVLFVVASKPGQLASFDAKFTRQWVFGGRSFLPEQYYTHEPAVFSLEKTLCLAYTQ